MLVLPRINKPNLSLSNESVFGVYITAMLQLASPYKIYIYCEPVNKLTLIRDR